MKDKKSDNNKTCCYLCGFSLLCLWIISIEFIIINQD